MPCISTPLCDAKGFTVWDEVVKKTAPMKESPVYAHDAMATIIYTSGTTGMPKGAMHHFGAFAHTAKALAATLKRIACLLKKSVARFWQSRRG